MTLEQFLTLGPSEEIQAITPGGIQTFTVTRFLMIEALDSKGEMCEVLLGDVVSV
jgi:hypothetical protein